MDTRYLIAILLFILSNTMPTYSTFTSPLAQYRYLEVFPGENLTSIIEASSPNTTLLLHKGNYTLEHIIDKQNIILTSYGDGEVFISFTDTLIHSCKELAIDHINIILTSNSSAIDHTRSITFISVNIIPNNIDLPISFTINESLVLLIDTYIKGSVLMLKNTTLNISNSQLMNNTILALNTNISITNSVINYTQLSVKGVMKYISLRNNIINNINKPIISIIDLSNSSTVLEKIILVNNTFIQFQKNIINILISNNFSINNIMIYNNTICAIETLMTITADKAELYIDSLNIINNYIHAGGYLSPLFIDIEAYNFSRVNISLLETIANTAYHTVYNWRDLNTSIMGLHAHLSTLSIALLSFYANIIRSNYVKPNIIMDGNVSIGKIYFYSTERITYIYRNREHSSFIGNYFRYLDLLGYNYTDQDGDGIADEQITFGPLYKDRYPISYSDINYSISLFNSTHFVVFIDGYKSIERTYKIGNGSLLFRTGFMEITHPIYGALEVGINYIAFKYTTYIIDKLVVFSTTDYASINYNGVWINITIYKPGFISIYLDNFFPILILSSGHTYIYNFKTRVISFSNTWWARIRLSREPLPASESCLKMPVLFMAISFIMILLGSKVRKSVANT